MKKAIKTCAFESCEAIAENIYCASHAALMRKAERQGLKDAEKHQKKMEAAKKGKSIAPMSPKMIEKMREYSKERALWLPGKMCVVHPERKATTVHHAKGRGIDSYADKWAEDNDVCLLLDKRFWVPASMEGHRYIELNPNWSKENGHSVSRL